MVIWMNKNNFHCVILSPKNVIFESEINSLFITGDRTEYELLAYHYPLIGLVQQGDIIIDWRRKVPINSGILRFFANECIILVEETSKTLTESQKETEQPIKI